MIDLNSNGFGIPDSWDLAYAIVDYYHREMANERYGGKDPKEINPKEMIELLRSTTNSRSKDPRNMYILERSDSGHHRWHHGGHGNSSTPSENWKPVCVIQEGSHASSYMQGFTDAIDAIEIVMWKMKKRIDSKQIEAMVNHLFEMGRI